MHIFRVKTENKLVKHNWSITYKKFSNKMNANYFPEFKLRHECAQNGDFFASLLAFVLIVLKMFSNFHKTACSAQRMIFL